MFILKMDEMKKGLFTSTHRPTTFHIDLQSVKSILELVVIENTIKRAIEIAEEHQKRDERV
jgi:hypothetical protein